MATVPFLIPPAPLPLLLMPAGSYAILYDIFVRATEDDLPHGWNSRRHACICSLAPNVLFFTCFTENTYRQLIRRLNTAGFFQIQYSDYCHPFIAPPAAWVVMLLLCLINPPGKLKSTVHGLKMHHIANPVCIVTTDIQHGGPYSLALRGPTPRDLVSPAAAAVLFPVPVIPAIAPPIPRYTRPSAAAAAVAGNWLQ